MFSESVLAIRRPGSVRFRDFNVIDNLILPGLATMVVAFGFFVWFSWLRKPTNRALNFGEDDFVEPTEAYRDEIDPRR